MIQQHYINKLEEIFKEQYSMCFGGKEYPGCLRWEQLRCVHTCIDLLNFLDKSVLEDDNFDINEIKNIINVWFLPGKDGPFKTHSPSGKSYELTYGGK